MVEWVHRQRVTEVEESDVIEGEKVLVRRSRTVGLAEMLALHAVRRIIPPPPPRPNDKSVMIQGISVINSQPARVGR